MPKSKPLIDTKGEVRELTAADMKRFRPAKEVLPATLLAKHQDAWPVEGSNQGANCHSSFAGSCSAISGYWNRLANTRGCRA